VKKHNDFSLLIFTDEKTRKYKIKINEQWGKKLFDTLAQAKVAALKGVEYYESKQLKH